MITIRLRMGKVSLNFHDSSEKATGIVNAEEPTIT